MRPSVAFWKQTIFLLILFLNLGGLVKKILETKRDYELSTSSLKSHEQVWKIVLLSVASTRGQYRPTTNSRHTLSLCISSVSRSLKKSLVPRASVVTTLKCPVQHWLLSKERYKQMEQRGVIEQPCNHKNVPLQ